MKTIILILCVFVLICCGCSKGSDIADVPVTDPSADIPSDINSQDAQPKPEAPPEEQLYKYILDPGFNRQDGITIPPYYAGEDIAFDFKEITDLGYPSGEWTVNEIEDYYGKANKVKGTLEFTLDIYIGIEYEGMSIVLIAKREGTLSFDISSNPKPAEYSLDEQDKTIRFPVSSIWITSKEALLPRGIRIGGSSIDQIKALYPPDAGFETDQDFHSLQYKYVDFDKIAQLPSISASDIRSIDYYFNDDGVLYLVLISW